MIKVLLADDHEILREGVKAAVADQKNIRIIGEVCQGQEVLEQVKKLKPDVLIIDVTMSGINGLEAVRMITEKHPEIKTLFLTNFDSDGYVLEAIAAGASGYLLKKSGREELVVAINKLGNGEKYFNSFVSNILANNYLETMRKAAAPPSEHTRSLTSRETEILKLIVEGGNNRDIAGKLGISIRTIETHRFKIMKKLHARNAVELVRVAFEERLI